MEPATLPANNTCCHKVTPQADAATDAYQPFVHDADGSQHRLLLAVEGIHCARCIHAIESALSEEEAVTSARVNMSTSRLVVEWRGDKALAAGFAEKVEALGYKVKPFEETTGKELSEEQRLLRCVAVSGFGMGNIMLLSVALWASDQAVMGIAMRDLFHWLSGLIALPVIVWAGRPFFSSALAVLKQGRTNMDVPISLALILACAMSLHETITHGEHAYFDSAVMLLFFLLIGRWLDARARGKARAGAESLLERMQGVAMVEGGGGKLQAVKISDLRAGMVVRVAAGEKIPADAVIRSGMSEVDMSLLNGETVPQAVQPGDMIYTGTINLSAPLTAVIEKAGEDSMLAGIVRLMEQAEQGRAKYVMLADKAARLYTPVVHTLAAGAFIGWLFIGGIAWQDALLIAVTTLIITCPCALGLAVPVVQVLTSGWLMKHGILLKSGDALERLSSVDTVVFDKTGTLTVDVPQLQEAPQDPALLQLAASLATHSRHPLAQALAAGFDGSLLTAEAVEEVPAHGMQAVIDGRSLRLGRRDWCGDALAQDSGMPELWLAEGEVPLAVFRFAAPVKDGAVELITRLKAQGMQLHLLSGDREAVVRQTAQELGMEAWKAACLPADKTAFIQQLRDSGRTVLMVGDGLNDAPALAAADVSIAPSGGVDITQNSADLIVQGNRLLPVLDALRMAKVSTKRVKENFALAVLYNCCAIPLAVAGYVTPLVAAIAMSSSSLLVIANSFRINLERPER